MSRAQEHRPDPQAARNRALRALAVRPRSVAELVRRLQGPYGETVAHTVVRSLEEQGLVDDASFAAAWCDSRDRLRPRSASLVRRELLQRGVARPLADAAVADLDDAAAAERVARKHWGRMARLDAAPRRRRMWALLARRGFSASIIQSTIHLLERESGEPDDSRSWEHA